MKKSLVIAILLLALTVSAFAGSFADVPANHWAYEAVNKLVAAGLITGYPDGTFKGQNTLTRYEVATILARLLENLAEARAELMDQVTFMLHDTVLSVESGLSVAQAEDVQAILQAVIEKNAGGAPVDALTAEDAAELYGTMLDLAIEFDKELMDLGIRVSKLEKRVADLENAEPAKAAVSFYGEYKAELKDYSYSATPAGAEHENPFNYKDDPKYGAGSEFKHSLDVNVKVENGPLAADMDLRASTRDFKKDGDDSKTGSFDLEGLSATITGNDFKATIQDDQVAGIRDYLFKGDDDHKVNGAVVETANGKYLLHGDTSEYAAAGSNSLDLLGGLNVVYGFEKKYEDVIDVNDTTTALFGVNKTFNLGDFDVTPEFAMNLGDAKDKYFTLKAAGDLGAIATTFNYKNIEAGFTPIRGTAGETKGFDVKGETSVGILDVVGYYEDYVNTLTYFTGEVKEENGIELLGFNFFADGGYRAYTNLDDATSKFFNLNAKNSYGKLDVHGKLEFQDTTQLFDDTAGDDYEGFADARFDKKLILGYTFSDALKAGAKYTLNKDNDLSEHVYTVDYDKGIVTAGAEFKLQDNDKENHFYAGLNADKAESFDLLNVAVTPYAEFKTWTVEEVTNIIAGVEAKKALNANADLVAGYEFYDSQKDLTDDDHDYIGHGTLKTTKVGVEYRITDDVKATFDYMHRDFVANQDLNPGLEDFEADLISAGVSVAF